MQGRVLLCSRAPLRPCSPGRCWAVTQTTDRRPPSVQGSTGARVHSLLLPGSSAPLPPCSSAPLPRRSPPEFANDGSKLDGFGARAEDR